MTTWFDLAESEERAVAAFMARVAALPTTATAPDAVQLWLKAQLLRRWDAERRAQLPLDVMQPIEIAAGLAAAALLLYLSLPRLF
ncbi:MAG: hypothetical protein HY657_13435 [Acidobacteria bacterium]|nr:hypothetical protein [Acidobacteriota bacterium]